VYPNASEISNSQSSAFRWLSATAKVKLTWSSSSGLASTQPADAATMSLPGNNLHLFLPGAPPPLGVWPFLQATRQLQSCPPPRHVEEHWRTSSLPYWSSGVVHMGAQTGSCDITKELRMSLWHRTQLPSRAPPTLSILFLWRQLTLQPAPSESGLSQSDTSSVPPCESSVGQVPLQLS